MAARTSSFYFLSIAAAVDSTNECTYTSKGLHLSNESRAFLLVYIFPTRRAMKILLALGATAGAHAPLAPSFRPPARLSRRVEVATCSVTIRPAGYSSVYP